MSLSRLLSRRAVLALALPATLGLAALTPAAHAQGGIVFTLNQSSATILQGQTFTFTGSLANNTGLPLRPLGVAGFYDPTFAYASGFPAFPALAAGQTFSGNLFTVDTSQQGFVGIGGQAGPTPVGSYTSFPTFYNYTDPSSNSLLSNSQQFTVRVIAPAPAVPEASTTVSLGLLLALGLGGTVMAARKKRKA